MEISETSPQIERARSVFGSRLQTLSGMLDKAADAWRSRGCDPDALLWARLAEDMHPLAFQIVFAAEQPRQFAAFCAGCEPGDFVDPKSLTLHSAQALLRDVRAAVQGIDTQTDALTRRRTLSLMGGITLDLVGSDYLHEFLLPNFYFHLVTAYAILRHQGVALGKADFMAHLASQVRLPG